MNYQQILKEHLSEKRAEHSINVGQTASYLAELYGYDEKDAYQAGCFHDILKELSYAQSFELIDKYNLVLSDVEKKSPNLWHAIIAPPYIEEKYGVTDENIKNAIRFHTTGKANMSLLEKILYVADFISDDREYEGVEALRNSAKKSLDEACYEGARFTIMKLSAKGIPVHSDTIELYNEMVLKKLAEEN